MQKEDAVDEFLKPHLLQVTALPNHGPRIRLIAIIRSEIVKMETSASSNGRFWILTTVEVVEPCTRVVSIETVHSSVIVVAKTLTRVAAPVIVVIEVTVTELVTEVKVLVIEEEVEVEVTTNVVPTDVVLDEDTVVVVVADTVVVLVEDTVDGTTSKCAAALLEPPQ